MALGLSSVKIFKSHWNDPVVSNTCTTTTNFIPLRIKTNHRLCHSISVANHPCFLPLIQARKPITCARKTGRHGGSQPSRKLMLELATMVALNLNILPQPLYSLIGEFAQRNGNEIFFDIQKVLRGGILNGWRRKKQSRGKLSWFVLVLICGMGLICWKISELDMFLRISCFLLIGLSMIQLWRRKAFKEWLLGFLLGIVLLSCKIGKEEMRFWVEKLKIGSVAQIVTKQRNRSKRKWGKAG